LGGSGSAESATDTGPAPEDHEGSGQTRTSPPRKRSLRGGIEVVVLVAVALAIAVIIKTFLVQAFYIPSASMEPTLNVGDRVLVNKLAYAFHPPSRGDVIVFTDPKASCATTTTTTPTNPVSRLFSWVGRSLGLSQSGNEDFIKRVIGLPGETLQGKDGQVWVNGKPLQEPYLNGVKTGDFGPVHVPAGDLFVMGDNRGNSNDSRYCLGPVPISDVVGKAFVKIWPFSRIGWL
jgi:signal peptidase I